MTHVGVNVRRVGVLYGGRSKERPGSLRSGVAVMEALTRIGYEVVPIDPQEPAFTSALDGIDCAFVALHGWYGEDGKIQGLLECLGIPYTGCGVLASAAGMNKIMFKKILTAENIQTPRYDAVLDGDADRIIANLGLPLVIKPVEEGGSLGVSICQTREAVAEAIVQTSKNYDELMAEEYISGEFMTVGLLGAYKSPRVLPVLHIEFDGEFYDYEIKHTAGASRYTVPAALPPEEYEAIQDLSKKVYLALGCHGAVRVDFIQSNNDGRGLYVLEANTVPGLSRIGNLQAIASAAGMPYDDLVQEILMSAFDKPRFLP
jgi:D-alanine-D-alanine ligase